MEFASRSINPNSPSLRKVRRYVNGYSDISTSGFQSQQPKQDTIDLDQIWGELEEAKKSVDSQSENSPLSTPKTERKFTRPIPWRQKQQQQQQQQQKRNTSQGDVAPPSPSNVVPLGKDKDRNSSSKIPIGSLKKKEEGGSVEQEKKPDRPLLQIDDDDEGEKKEEKDTRFVEVDGRTAFESGVRGIVLQVKENPPPSSPNGTTKNLNHTTSRDSIRDQQDSQKSDQEYIEQWLDFREKEYGYKGIDTKHSCTFTGCVSLGNTQTICSQRSIYGCLVSGVYHICKRDTLACRFTTINPDGTITCNLSGLCLGVMIEEHLWGKPDTGKEEANPYKKRSVEEMRISKLMKKLKESGLGGMDSVTEGNSLEDEEFASNYSDDEFSTSDEDSTTHHSKRIQIDDDDPNFEDNAPKRKKRRSAIGNKPKQRHCFNLENLSSIKKDASLIIYDLLFNKLERSKIDNRIVREMRSETKNEIRKKYKEYNKKRRVENIHRIEDIYDHFMNTKRRLLQLEYDPVRAAYYLDVSITLWKLIVETPYCKANQSKFHVKEHVLGVLYILQMPFNTETEDGKTIQLLPRDEYLYRLLPDPSDLKDLPSTKGWKYYPNNITKGKNNIKQSIESVIEPLQKIKIIEDIRELGKRSPDYHSSQ